MLHCTTCLWYANAHSLPHSLSYDEAWVVKLYWGFRRNLTVPFRFVVFTDRRRAFPAGIDQEPLLSAEPDGPGYGSFTEPYRLNVPMIHVGLDTIIVGNIDHLARYCLTTGKIALCRDLSPKHRNRSINGVALVPAGHRRIYDEWVADGGQANDMEWLRRYPWACLNDEFPGQISSFKTDMLGERGYGLRRERIVYMHGLPKANALTHIDWVRRHWRIGP